MDKNKLAEYICTVDDIGLNPELDETIIAYIKKGLFQRVSIIVNLHPLESFITAIHDANVSIQKDIHLNSTEKLAPATVGNENPIMIAARRALFLLGTFSKQRRAKLYEDWEKQIATYKTLFNETPDGINSHEHIHLMPHLFPLAVQLAQKHGIRYIRLGNSPTPIITDYRTALLQKWHKQNKGMLQNTNLITSSSLYSYNWKAMSLTQLRNSVPTNSEVLFHLQYNEDITFLDSLS